MTTAINDGDDDYESTTRRMIVNKKKTNKQEIGERRNENKEMNGTREPLQRQDRAFNSLCTRVTPDV